MFRIDQFFHSFSTKMDNSYGRPIFKLVKNMEVLHFLKRNAKNLRQMLDERFTPSLALPSDENIK